VSKIDYRKDFPCNREAYQAFERDFVIHAAEYSLTALKPGLGSAIYTYHMHRPNHANIGRVKLLASCHRDFSVAPERWPFCHTSPLAPRVIQACGHSSARTCVYVGRGGWVGGRPEALYAYVCPSGGRSGLTCGSGRS
jgi:hypothetical protein